MKTLTDLGHEMTFILRRRKHIEDPRYRGGLLSWLLVDDGWITPVWTHLTHYSEKNDVVRFRNDLHTQLPKSQWNHRLPGQFSFEMTAMVEECNTRLLTVVIDYCELARRQPKSGFDRHPPEFPTGASHGGYGWTQKAWDTVSERNKRNR
jgi:hypothetical protein